MVKLSPKTDFLKTIIKRCGSKNQKLSQDSYSRKTLGYSLLQISVMSDINPPLSLMGGFSTYAVWFEEILDGKIGS